ANHCLCGTRSTMDSSATGTLFGLWAFAVLWFGDIAGIYPMFLADAADPDLADCTGQQRCQSLDDRPDFCQQYGRGLCGAGFNCVFGRPEFPALVAATRYPDRV